MSSPSRRALFIDRDGIFHRLVAWEPGGELCAPRNWSEWHPYPEINGIEKVKSLGCVLVLVTNQPDVERGDIELAFVNELNEKYRREFSLDGVYCCLNASESHPWKKPNPGMFLQAAIDLSVSLPESFHLGDTERDVEVARRAGCRSILWDRPYNRDLSSDFRITQISELCDILRAQV